MTDSERAVQRTYTKCRCGNTARFNETSCGACIESDRTAALEADERQEIVDMLHDLDMDIMDVRDEPTNRALDIIRKLLTKFAEKSA